MLLSTLRTLPFIRVRNKSVKFCEVFSTPPRYTQRMKRVMRDVIKIVTTVRRLPVANDWGEQTTGHTAAELPLSNAADGNVPTQTTTAWAEPFPEYVYSTYLLIYRVVDD